MTRAEMSEMDNPLIATIFQTDNPLIAKILKWTIRPRRSFSKKCNRSEKRFCKVSDFIKKSDAVVSNQNDPPTAARRFFVLFSVQFACFSFMY